MTTKLDIYRTAKELIEQRGLKGASVYAAARITTLTNVHDMDGVAVWGRTRAALLGLSDIRFKDDPVNLTPPSGGASVSHPPVDTAWGPEGRTRK